MQTKVIMSIITFFLCSLVILGARAEEKRYDTGPSIQAPLDIEIGGSMQSSNMHVSFSSKVSMVRGTEKFLYWYKVSNSGLTIVLVQWELLARASSGRYNFPTLVFLDPGASKEFWLETEELPEETEDRVYIFERIDDRYMAHEREEYGFWGQREDEWVMMMRSSMPGFIPRAWLKSLN